MDDRTHADGDIGEDDECEQTDENQQKDRHKIQHADVLVHRQGGCRDGRAAFAAGERKAVPVRPDRHQRGGAQPQGRHQLLRHPLYRRPAAVQPRLPGADHQSGGGVPEQLPRRLYDCRHIRDDPDRARLHCEPIHRQVPQPDGNVGQVPQKLVQDAVAGLVPVPPRADGRRRRGAVFGEAAEGNLPERVKKIEKNSHCAT